MGYYDDWDDDPWLTILCIKVLVVFAIVSAVMALICFIVEAVITIVLTIGAVIVLIFVGIGVRYGLPNYWKSLKENCAFERE